jgi:WD40 repeat protein
MFWHPAFALRPDGRLLAWSEVKQRIENGEDPTRPVVVHYDNYLRMITLRDGLPLGRFDRIEGTADNLFFPDDGRSLAMVDHHRLMANVRIWDVKSCQLQRSFPAAADQRTQVKHSQVSQAGRMLAVVSAPSGPLEHRVESRQPVKLWDMATGQEIAGPLPQLAKVEVMAFTVDGRTIAVPCPNRTIELQDATTGQFLRRIPGPPDPITALAFGPESGCSPRAGTGRLWPGTLVRSTGIDERPRVGYRSGAGEIGLA